MELRVFQPKQGETKIMPFSKKIYTIADIEALQEGERAELINGEIFMLATPNTLHQELLVELTMNIYSQIKQRKGKCKLYPAPFAVYLHNDDKTYLEPDISVICEKDKVDIKGCHGAPDWVIEITSPSTSKRDYGIKLEEYQKAGVREYWIVDPYTREVTVYCLQMIEETPKKYSFTDCIKVGIYEDFEVDFGEITRDITGL